MNTMQANPVARRSLKLAMFTLAYGLRPRNKTTGRANWSALYDWALTAKAKVHRVPGGYALFLYRTPEGKRLPCIRLMVPCVWTGVSFFPDGTYKLRHEGVPFANIGDALRCQRLYTEGRLPSDYLTDHVPHGWDYAGSAGGATL